MIAVQLSQVSVYYRDVALFSEITHCFEAGMWHIVLGRSGVGKSTLLHAIADLLPDSAKISGTISDAQDAPLTGKLSLLAQENDLLAWLNARENVVIGAKLRGEYPDLDKADALLAQVGLFAHRHHFPKALSGGQKQRVAIARTLYEARPLILMDEPFSALDAPTRHQLQDHAATLLKAHTVIMITHDPAEALRLADKLYLLDNTGLHPLPLPKTNAPRAIDSTGFALCQRQLIERLTPSEFFL